LNAFLFEEGQDAIEHPQDMRLGLVVHPQHDDSFVILRRVRPDVGEIDIEGYENPPFPIARFHEKRIINALQALSVRPLLSTLSLGRL
jgi:hypothetical protein